MRTLFYNCSNKRKIMTSRNIVFYAFMQFFVSVFSRSLGAGKDHYIAAVLEHAPVDSRNLTPSEIIRENLYIYEKATETAKLKGADIIVFPEYGLFTPNYNRLAIKAFLENIPDPKKSGINPCRESVAYGQKPILRSLSCLARNNSIYLLANMGDIQDCKKDPWCPPDGVFHFNTNVVFDRSGTLLLKYHKEHLFGESSMNQPNKTQDSTFETDFGKFATYICFDSVFKRMSDVARWPSVDGIIMSSMWLNPPPQFSSIQYWQGWALGNNASLVVANIQKPGGACIGSGIFHSKAGAVGYTFNPDGKSKLVVAKIPKLAQYLMPFNSSITIITKKEAIDFKDDGKDVPKDCSKKIRTKGTNGRTDYYCLEEDTTNYSFVKLREPRGTAKICNNGLCCYLNYSTDGFKENFFLGAYNGTFNSINKYFWKEENCILTVCEAHGENPCAIFPQRSNTSFYEIKLWSKFTTKFVYPSIVSSGMRLVPRTEWTHRTNELSGNPIYSSRILFRSEVGSKLIAVGFKGRCFERDPPFPKH